MKTSRFVLIFLCLACGVAFGDLVVSLSPAVEYGGHGAEIVFSGTLTNSSATDKVFLNDIAFSLTGASATYLTPESNSYFANVPGILLPGESYAGGEIFRVILSPGAPTGDYVGTVSLSGGADITAAGNLASLSFTVRETPMENWRFENFGADWNTPQAGDTADFENDGIPNILEYGLDLNPKLSDNFALPSPFISAGYLTLSYMPNLSATDLAFAVESSTDLLNWGTTDVVDLTPVVPIPPGSKTYRYKYPVSQAPHAFLRLRVTRQ